MPLIGEDWKAGVGGRYHRRYAPADVEAWVAVFSGFDNDVKSAAPSDARLAARVGS